MDGADIMINVNMASIADAVDKVDMVDLLDIAGMEHSDVCG